MGIFRTAGTLILAAALALGLAAAGNAPAAPASHRSYSTPRSRHTRQPGGMGITGTAGESPLPPCISVVGPATRHPGSKTYDGPGTFTATLTATPSGGMTLASPPARTGDAGGAPKCTSPPVHPSRPRMELQPGPRDVARRQVVCVHQPSWLVDLPLIHLDSPGRNCPKPQRSGFCAPSRRWVIHSIARPQHRGQPGGGDSAR